MTDAAHDPNVADEAPAEQTREQLPHVEHFEVVVEQHDEGWAVFTEADGVRALIRTFPAEQNARFYADQLGATATRHDDAAHQEPVPDSYPGKGVDER